jgi:hypothetical protein
LGPRLPRGLEIALIGAVLAGARGAHAQQLAPQPHCESIVVQLQSLLDDVQVYPGDLLDPPYLYRSFTPAPRVELSQTFPIAMLRILDNALTDDLRPDAGEWAIELMPAKPVSFDLRLDGGKGRFDFTGMSVPDLALFASFSEVTFDFGRPNPVRLESSRITLQSGQLTWRNFLNAAPSHVVLELPRTKTRIELSGKPFDGEATLLVEGAPQSLHLSIPPDLPLWIEGPAANLRAFRAGQFEAVAGGLRSSGYDSAPCRIHLRIEKPVSNLSVDWIHSLEIEGATPARPTRTATGSTPVPAFDLEADRRVDAIVEAISSSAPATLW